MQVWKMGGLCAAVVLVASVSLSAIAQGAPGAGQGRGQGRGGFGQGRGGFGQQITISNIPDAVLASELKLTDDQKTKIAAIKKKSRDDMQALQPTDGSQPDFRALAPKMQEINQQTTKDIEAALTDDQKTQSKGLIKDLQSLRSVGIPIETYGDLKLTDDEKKKITALATDIDKDRTQKIQDAQAARQAGDQAKAQEIMQSLRGTGGPNEKALAVLTDTQKETVTKYIKDHPQGRRPGGARPGGNPPPPPAGK